MPMSITERLQQGPATSRELQRVTGLNQSAISRQTRALGSKIIKLREGRTLRYYLTSNAFGADDNLPLYMIDPHGNNAIVANIRPLAHGGFYIEPRTGMPMVLLGANRNGLFEDLPYFLDDLRPQGFLGRQIAEQMSQISPDFPADPRHWSMDHVGSYLVSNGDDLPGNFKFGQHAHLRVRQRPVAMTHNDYPELADAVLRGTVPGSSAGGEQPKFTAYNAERGHVIVKFSPAKRNPVSNRWRDILLTEFHATEAIHAYGFPAAETRIFELGGRLFLESQRFDRSGEFGRLPLISLQAVDNEFTGIGSNWPAVMNALGGLGLVNAQHIYDVEVIWYFGRLINNTDMHLGNLSLSLEGNVFRILPAYDMCSMGFAPRGGEVEPYAFSPPVVDRGLMLISNDTMRVVEGMAHDFWDRLANDDRISDELRMFMSQGNPIDNLPSRGPQQLELHQFTNTL